MNADNYFQSDEILNIINKNYNEKIANLRVLNSFKTLYDITGKYEKNDKSYEEVISDSDSRIEFLINSGAENSISNVKCDTLILDEISKSDTVPVNSCFNISSSIEHEATVSKISDDNLFYLMSRGISEERAMELIVLGFLEKFREELPMEYAVELNQLIKRNL